MPTTLATIINKGRSVSDHFLRNENAITIICLLLDQLIEHCTNAYVCMVAFLWIDFLTPILHTSTTDRCSQERSLCFQIP